MAVERGDGQAQDVGRPERGGDASQESEPSWYRTSLEAHARETIVWHRRETRRQTENTNVTPTALEDLSLLDKNRSNETKGRKPLQKLQYVAQSKGCEEIVVQRIVLALTSLR